MTHCSSDVFVFTVKVTAWRTHFRRTMNDFDSKANSRAIDSLLNYETVKYFGNEEWEARRYDENLKRYRAAAIKSQRSLSMLNFGQQTIIGTGVVFILWRAAIGIVPQDTRCCSTIRSTTTSRTGVRRRAATK